MRPLLKPFLVGLLSFCLGLLAGWYFEYQKQETIPPQKGTGDIEITSEIIKPEVLVILGVNPDISTAEAVKIYGTIETVVGDFQSDPYYTGGVTEKINARLVLSLIITESHCRKMARGTSGEIGLTQVMPFHAKSLYRAGILSKPEPSQLWDIKKNIKSGVYILMMQARESKTLKEALARYNAGPKRVKAGMAYALKVMGRYSRIDG